MKNKVNCLNPISTNPMTPKTPKTPKTRRIITDDHRLPLGTCYGNPLLLTRTAFSPDYMGTPWEHSLLGTHRMFISSIGMSKKDEVNIYIYAYLHNSENIFIF